MMPVALFLGTSILLFASGCGDHEKVHTDSAQVALDNGLPQKARELAELYLRSHPEDMPSLRIKADAEMMLGKMEECRTTLNRHLELAPDDKSVRMQLVQWAWARLDRISRKSLTSDGSVWEQIEDAILTGLDQANWYYQHEWGKAEAHYIRARCADYHVRRLQKQFKSRRVTIDHHLQGVEQQEEEGRVIQGKITAKVATRDEHLEAALAADPLHFSAIELCASTTVERRAWQRLWTLAQQCTDFELPAKTAWDLVTGIVSIPTSEVSLAECQRIGWQIHDAVKDEPKEEATRLVVAARLHQMAEQWDQAHPLLARALELDPSNHLWRYEMARNHYGQERYHEAVDLLKPLFHLIPNMQLKALYAHALSKAGEGNQARAVMRAVLQESRHNAHARETMLALLVEEGYLDEAEQDVVDYTNTHPGNARAMLIAIHFELARGRIKDATQLLEQLEKVDPLGVDHLRVLVEGYFKIGHRDKVRTYAQRLASAEPNKMESQILLAEAMIMGGEDAAARRLLEKTFNRLGHNDNIDFLIGQLYMHRQRYDKAVEVLEQVLAAAADDTRARLLLARALASQAHTDEAMEQIDTVLKKNPSDPAAHALKMRIYQFLGDMAGVEHHLSQIDSSAIDKWESPVLYAQLQLESGELNQALAVCNLALTSGHVDPTLHLLLAQIYRQKSDASREQMHLLALMHRLPNNPMVYRLLTRYYIRHNPEEGIRLLKEQQETSPVQATVALATLLEHVGELPRALPRLEPIYEDLLARRSRDALTVAHALSKVHVQMDNPSAAAAVYERMIKADLFAQKAQFRQIGLGSNGSNKNKVDRFVKFGASLGPEQRRLRKQVIRELKDLKATDRAEKLLNDWMALEGPSVLMLQTLGQLAMEQGNTKEAIDIYARAKMLDPKNLAVHLKLAEAHERALDAPAALGVYRTAQPFDVGARQVLLGNLGRMQERLGLHRKAAETYSEVRELGPVRNPRLLYDMANNAEIMGDMQSSRTWFAQISSMSREYVPAQIRLCLLEQSSAATEPTLQPIRQLAENPRLRSSAEHHFLALDIRDPRVRPLVLAFAEALPPEESTEHLTAKSISIRLLTAADQQDWPTVLIALEDLDRLQPEQPSVVAARIVLLAHAGRKERARQLYRFTPMLKRSIYGLLLAGSIGSPISGDEGESPLSAFLVAMMRADLNAAQEAAGRFAGTKMIFAADVLSVSQRHDAKSEAFAVAVKRLGLAQLALMTRLPQLAEQISAAIIREMPNLSLAYSVLANAVANQGKAMDPVFIAAGEQVPDSSIGLYLKVLKSMIAQDHEGAIERAQILLDREPNNVHVQFTITEVLQSAGQIERAVPYWQQLITSENAYRIAAANNCAFFLSRLDTTRLDESVQITTNALELAPNNYALLDTLGWIEHLRGNNTAALGHLRRALVGMKSRTAVHYHLGRVYHALGDTQWALSHLEQAAHGRDGQPNVNDARKLLAELGIEISWPRTDVGGRTAPGPQDISSPGPN